ncbi:MAG: hypothetical protein KBS66_07460 [Eubacterium sp.]|nr:hypothetical protein [Candidatus Colimonas fimequi]
MIERLTKLIDVKSIMTLVFTFVFAYLSVAGHVKVEQFIQLFTIIIGFYFGVQSTKEK